MTGGVVIGGWEFVIAAYSLTTVALAGYTASVLLRLKAERVRAEAARLEQSRESA
ncbi:MAG: hypothetical protein ACK4N5_02630 [Myxococcales bacterium]